VAEAWKDNLMDELVKGESEVETAEQLFLKIRNNFGETSEEERKIEQLRTIEQGSRTCDEYIQEFKKGEAAMRDDPSSKSSKED